MFLDVVIVNWNSGRWLRECLRALAAAAPRACTVSRVIVVDNASTDGSCDGLDVGAAFPLIVVRNDTNRGFAAACNQGAADARGDYLLFLNPDTVPTAEALDAAIGLLEAHAADVVPVRIAGVWLDNTNGPDTLWLGAFPTARTFMLQAIGGKQRWTKSVELAPLSAASGDPFGAIEVASVGGAFFVISRSLFEELEGFDERFFMYYDELDLCLRARRHGARAMVASRIRIYHHVGASTDRVPGKRLFYLLRSRLRYAHAHFSMPETIILALLMFTTEPLLRLARATAGRGPERLHHVLEAYVRFIASLAGFRSNDRTHR
jgi:N-acetylglucosaminyl-diphospho-decaprenol L-rhamnosyltransferase